MITKKEIIKACETDIKELKEFSEGRLRLSDVNLTAVKSVWCNSKHKKDDKGVRFICKIGLSYQTFIHHYKEMHSEYICGGDYKEGKTECVVCPDCEKLIGNMINCLEEEIKDNTPVQKQKYYFGDRFRGRRSGKEYVLMNTRCNTYNFADITEGVMLIPKNIHYESLDDINATSCGDLTQISGKYFEENQRLRNDA